MFRHRSLHGVIFFDDVSLESDTIEAVITAYLRVRYLNPRNLGLVATRNADDLFFVFCIAPGVGRVAYIWRTLRLAIWGQLAKAVHENS